MIFHSYVRLRELGIVALCIQQQAKLQKNRAMAHAACLPKPEPYLKLMTFNMVVMNNYIKHAQLEDGAPWVSKMCSIITEFAVSISMSWMQL